MGSHKRKRAAQQWQRFCTGFDKAAYQEMLAALLPLTLSPPLNTVLIMPDGDEAIMQGMFELFEELAKAGGTLKVRVLFPCVCAVIQDATSFP